MATTTSAFSLATSDPYTGGPDGGPGDVNSGPGSASSGNAAGASGSSPGSVEISRGAMIAIIVVVVVVSLFGIGSSVLFYVAKKREWKIRETIRRSARKVVTALTPRRSEFPSSVKDSGRSRGGRARIDDVPPTPRLKPDDLEKGLATDPRRFNKKTPKKSRR